MDMRTVSDTYMVCLCRTRTKEEILAYIKENDIHDLKSLREGFNIGNRCGACAFDLETLIEMAWE